MDSLLKSKISDLTLVAFDTETTGPYPVKDDIVEFGAVKWKNGEEVDRIEFLFKPKNKMTDFNYKLQENDFATEQNAIILRKGKKDYHLVKLD